MLSRPHGPINNSGYFLVTEYNGTMSFDIKVISLKMNLSLVMQ